MPDIPFLPFWAEIVFWVWLFGFGLTLVLLLGVDYQYQHFRGLSIYIEQTIALSVLSVVWFVYWPLVINLIRLGEAKPPLYWHAVRALFGRKASLQFLVDHNYYKH